MKTHRLLPLVLICLLLSGCGKTDPAPPSPLQLAQQFTAKAEILCGNASMHAQVTRDAAGAFTLKFTDPPAIEPLTVCATAEGCTAQYGALAVTVTPERLPHTLAAALLADTWQVLTNGADVSRAMTDGVWRMQGSGSHGAFDFTCDAATGAPLTLTVEHAGLHVTFSDFRSITET